VSDDRARFYPRGWFDGPLAIVTSSHVRIHYRSQEEPWWHDDRALARWFRGLVAERSAQRRGRRGYIPDRVWLPILAAFGNACAYCGATDVPLEKEHRVAVSRGGTDDPSNLVPACKPCNVRKSNHDPADWPLLVDA
jgi:5-methylcytosine-specific restriction endonuclease McrA